MGGGGGGGGGVEGGEMFYISLYKENVINYSCLKPQGLEP